MSTRKPTAGVGSNQYVSRPSSAGLNLTRAHVVATLTAVSSHRPEDLTVEDVTEVLGRGPSSWIGDCYRVSQHLLEEGAVTGRWVRGTFNGIGHGWIELTDGRYFDATQWTMTDNDPFIFVGPPDGRYHETGLGRFDRDVEHLAAHRPGDVIAHVTRSFPSDRYLTPDGAFGQCETAASLFHDRLTERGVPCSYISTEYMRGPDGEWYSHTAAVADGIVYDWTARQYDPSLPVPHVCTIPEFTERFPDAVEHTELPG